ncbi:MAG: histidine kinase, partial [Gallionella sp.]|nr:histidine kinase [Gallionella sp.]
MNEPRSIKQNSRPDALPDFRNLGVMLRILLISIGLAILHAYLLASAWDDVPQRMMEIASLLTPVMLTSLLVLWVAQPWVIQLSYQRGALVVTALVLVLTLSINYLGSELFQPTSTENRNFNTLRYGLISVIESGILLLYFRLRSRILSQSLYDARLQALRARIRPHFLFNSINAVLGIVRVQPKRAEAALEDMADLFRMAMSDEGDLVPLRQEIRLCEQYMALEKLRLGDRLRMDWQLHDVPGDAMIPPLLLQPLLENAVYHGIESLPQGGCVDITLRLSGNELQLQVKNPSTPRSHMHHHGSKVALSNIRERLDLLFDAEARYNVESSHDFYCVEIAIP